MSLLEEGCVDRLLQFIETREGRNKVITVLERFTIVGGTLVTIMVLVGLYLRDS